MRAEFSGAWEALPGQAWGCLVHKWAPEPISVITADFQHHLKKTDLLKMPVGHSGSRL